MRRDIFMEKQIQHTETGKMSFRMTSFEEILSYFKLSNGWLISKLCAKRQLLHSDENEYVFFVKKETLKFVPLYFFHRWTFLLPFFPEL